jgi:hypothetical protein
LIINALKLKRPENGRFFCVSRHYQGGQKYQVSEKCYLEKRLLLCKLEKITMEWVAINKGDY